MDERRRRSPWLLKGTKTGKKRMIIQQDPARESSITLPRSDNRLYGLEYSYMFWMFLDDMTYRYGEWKHVLHKGSKSGWPLECQECGFIRAPTLFACTAILLKISESTWILKIFPLKSGFV